MHPDRVRHRLRGRSAGVVLRCAVARLSKCLAMRRLTVDPAQYRKVAFAALAFCTLIVFTGAVVRLTGSGLGCPTWPRCEGHHVTPELRVHSLIEFSNRVM